MTPTPADIVAAARMQVYSKHPYLSAVLFGLRPHAAPGLGTVAVDQGWRLYYDPETVTQWYEEAQSGQMNKVSGSNDWHHGVAGAVFHELGHVLRQHFARCGDRDPREANKAMDREINDDVIAAGWRLPGQPLLPADIGMEDGLTFEEYYKVATPNPSIQRNTPGCGGACGGIAGNPTEWEKNHQGDAGRSGAAGQGEAGQQASDSPCPAPAGDLEQQIALRKTALDTLNHVKSGGRGTVPAGLQAWATSQLTPAKVDWRKKLASLTRQALAACTGACDFTWRRTGRRALASAGRAGWPLAPALHQPLPRVAIVLDTSGSMGCKGSADRTRQEEALSEVLGIVQASGGDAWGVACDAAVEALARVRSVRDLQKLNKGGGGTIMTPGVLAARKIKPDVIVIVTDGYVGDGWPSAEECRGTRVLAACVGGYTKDVPAHIPFVEVD